MSDEQVLAALERHMRTAQLSPRGTVQDRLDLLSRLARFLV